MPYHDPFQHQHLFDLVPPPSFSSAPSRSYGLPNAPPRSFHAHNVSFNPGRSQPGPENMLNTTSRSPPMTASQRHARTSGAENYVSDQWFANSTAKRVNTDIYIYQALKQANPDAEVLDTDAYQTNIFAYIKTTGDGEVKSLSRGSDLSALLDNVESCEGPLPNGSMYESSNPGMPDSMRHIDYFPPYRRMGGGKGVLVADPLFEKFLVKWHGHEFVVYIVDARDGTSSYPTEKRQFIITVDPGAALTLVKEVGSWGNVLHEQIWVFDQGFWEKDAALYAAIQKSDWRDIILPELLKEDLLKTVLRFYDSQETYSKLRVPWKRGLIFYGPPGNGKTVTIKAQ